MNRLEQIEDTANRLDVLLYRMAERVVSRSPNPVIRGAWSRFQNPLAEFLENNLGPIPLSGELEKRMARKGTGSQRGTGKRRRRNPARRARA